MATTIYDIAKRVNTSAATVSMALRDSSKISVKTVEKIKKVAAELNYRPNAMARGLVGSCTKTLAFVFNYPTLALVNDRSFMHIFHDFARHAQSLNYRVLFHSVTEVMPIDEIISEMRCYGVSGILLASRFDEQQKEKVFDANFPIVMIDRDSVGPKASCIMLDDKGGAIKAMKYLHELGHRRIAFAGNMPNRLRGYIESLDDLGSEMDKSLIFHSPLDIDSGEQLGLEIAETQPFPTAILAASDMLAFGIISGLDQRGISVPQDVSVIGFDNIDLARVARPNLTTIDLSRQLAATRAVELLIDIMENDKTGTKEHMKSRLIIRNSTSPPQLI